MCDISIRIGRGPRLGKMGREALGPELANVIKRMCDISVRIGRGPRLWKMGWEAQGSRISKCRKENV